MDNKKTITNKNNIKLSYNKPSKNAIKAFVKKSLEIYNNIENSKISDEIEVA